MLSACMRRMLILGGEMKSVVLMMVWLALFSASFKAMAEDAAPLPQTLPGATTVDAEGVIDLIGSQPALIVVDARITTDRQHGHIEGSISLPDIETDCDSLAAKVSMDKTTPLLFYCNGVKCGRSVKSVRIAKACGFSRLYWFRGGFEEWLQKDYPYLKE